MSASAVVIHYTKRRYIKCMQLYLYLYAYSCDHYNAVIFTDQAFEAAVITTIRLPLDCNSTALRLFYVTASSGLLSVTSRCT